MAPICLIEALPSGGWRVNDSALCILKNVQQPVQVIAIFGPKGTGKSFLMNKIAETQQGFRLSLPGGPCTEGIWMLCFPHPSLKEHHLVLLDIEGFDTEKGDKRKEIKLFILAVLLSNVFIYNTQGGVTQEELQKLIYVKELPHLVKAASDEETNTCLLASLLPHFIWCSRDTILDLNMGEEILTPEDYLNDVLNARQGAESSVCWINKLFLQPRLYDICEPCPTARFVNLDSLPEDQLAFLFKKQVQTLKEYIFNKGTKTITGGEKATGQMLACLVESLTSSLSEGDVVPLDKVFERVAWKEGSKKPDSPDCSFPCSNFTEGNTLAHPVVSTTRDRKQEFGEEIKCVGPSQYSPKFERVVVQQSGKPTSSTRTRKQLSVNMEKPICLIENSASGDLHVNQKALEILSEVQQPVIVVAIVGLYRTGKSYLMNKLARKQKGFSLGSTVESHTKGIWMWCVPHPIKQDHTLVLLDTEGLGDVNKGDEKNDCWIFALAVLLSSMFVYNSMGTIDQNALDKLHYVTELTECIKVKSCNSKDEDDSFHFSRFFPAFVWTVRDFILELKLDGHPITENEYLEHALQLRPGYGAKVQKYNFPRQCIRSYFPSRKCFVFERPVSCVEKLRKLEEVSENELETSFVKQAKEFCHYVFETAKTKTLHGGHNVTGTLLGNLAVTYVDAIRSGAVPCLENAVVALAQIENSAAVRQAHEHYMKEMERLVKFPTATIEEFSELHAVCGKEAIQVFMNRSFKDDDRTHQGELMRVINLSYENFRQKNEQESANLCTKVITDVSKTLEERITMGYYSKSGGYRCFIEDQEKMIKDYKASIVKGIKLEDVLNDFLKEKEIIAQTILLADNTLTEKEKQIEAERIKAEATQQEMKVMEKNQEALQQMVVDQERSYQENVQQLMEKMEVDRGKLLEEQKRVLAQKLKEQETLLKSGFDEQADRMEAQIRDLRRDLDQTQSSSWLSDALDALGTVATCFLPGIVGKGIGLATKLFSRLF